LKNRVHEKFSTSIFKSALKDGFVHLEVGANIGYYALISADIAGSRGTVISLEPNQDNMDILKANVALNRYEDRFKFYNVAASSSNGEKNFYVTNKSNTCSFLERNDEYIHTKEVRKVQTVILDEFLKGQHIDYFRMDIEGYEFEVLKGMSNILSREHPPSGCFIEVHSGALNNLGSSTREFVQYLEKYGYKIAKAMYRGSPDQLVQSNIDFYKHELIETGYWEIFFKFEG